jgi:peptide/nickel transport system substrate-binding protein
MRNARDALVHRAAARGVMVVKHLRYALQFAGAIAAALGLGDSAHADRRDDTLRLATPDVLESTNPYFSQTTVGQLVADAAFDTLIYRNPRTAVYEGNLATAWRWIDDRTLELTLRRGVAFHDGEPFDADDVVFSIDFLANPDNKAVYLGLIRWLDHAEKLDSHTVRIVSKTPFPAAVAFLSNPLLAMQPNEYYARVGSTGVSARPIGTGPYRVLEHAQGSSVRLERNPRYFEGGPKRAPRIGHVEVRFVPDAQTRVAEVVAGGVDVIMGVVRDQAEQLRDIAHLQVRDGRAAGVRYLQMSTLAHSPSVELRDVRVRRAIMHAIDRETMARHLGGSRSLVVDAFCHPRQFGCTGDAMPHYAYDPAKSRQLLAEAGYANGFSIDLYASGDRNQTEAIIGYLAEVGIRAQPRFLAFQALAEAVRRGRASLIYNGMNTSIADVSNATSRLFEFSADDVNRDPEVRDWLLRADSSMDSTRRQDAYARALRLIAEHAYVLPLFTVTSYYVASQDLVFDPFEDDRLRFYEMEWR